MGKRGRKSGFNESLQSRIVALVEEGKTLAQVAEIIGVSIPTIYNWFGQHKDLLYAVRQARQIADELVEAALFSRAQGYSHPEEKVFCTKDGEIITHDTQRHHPPDTQAAMFWLRNRQPEKWREKVEGTEVNVNLSPAKLTDEQLDARIAAHLAKAKK